MATTATQTPDYIFDPVDDYLRAELYKYGFDDSQIDKIDLWEALRILGAYDDPNMVQETSTPAASPAKASTSTTNDKPKKSSPDDSKLAARWINENIKKKRPTAYGLEEFKRYKDGIWENIDEDTIKKEIKAILDNARSEGVRVSNGLLNSVLALARTDISLPNETWNAQTDYLVCKNGTLHIPSRTLVPHSPHFYATSRLNYDYDPLAKAPYFEMVLNQQIPDAASFMQEFAGYALTTSVEHEIALWFYGPPGCGKSTIIVGLQAMLGERAGLLGLADIERSRFSLSNITEKTLLVSTEQTETFITATHIVDAIISGEPITVEKKFKDQITITPYAKIVWAMNDLPRVNGVNNGIMRRVKVISFPALAAANRNPDIKEKIKTEGAGILNIALDGLERLNKRKKFLIPKCVEDATQEFIDNNDIPNTFLQNSNLVWDSQGRIQSQHLYDLYHDWCARNGHKSLSSTSMAKEWKRLGLTKREINGLNYWEGIRIP